MKITLSATVFRACQSSTGVKDVREYLNWVYLDIDAEMAVATDGHIMAEGPIGGIEERGKGDDLPGLLVRADKLIPPSWLVVTIDTKTHRITGHKAKTQSCGVEFGENPQSYPDWTRVSAHNGQKPFVQASNGDRRAHVGFGPSILSRVSGNHAVRMEFPSSEKLPMRCFVQGADYFVTFMGARV